MEICKQLPPELLHKVLLFTNKVVYRNNNYIVIGNISTFDKRYSLLRKIIQKKTDILRRIELWENQDSFYFEFEFDSISEIGLCYDLDVSIRDVFHICYFDLRNDGWKQIRTFF